MIIEREFLSVVPLKRFASEHNLVMKIVERSPQDIRHFGIARFYAHFKDVEIMDNGFLEGATGEGNTPKDAVKDYAKKIAGKRIAWRAYQKDRRNIVIPEKLGA